MRYGSKFFGGWCRSIEVFGFFLLFLSAFEPSGWKLFYFMLEVLYERRILKSGLELKKQELILKKGLLKSPTSEEHLDFFLVPTEFKMNIWSMFLSFLLLCYLVTQHN